MSLLPESNIWYAFAGITFIIFLIFLNDVWTWSRMPPGPTPLPFIGTKLPKNKKPWIHFQELSQKYGPIFTLWIGRRPTIVISDPCIAAELMEKRSPKYSSRPRFVVMGEMYSAGNILVAPYGKEWSTRRKLLHKALTPAALLTYRPRQNAEATKLLSNIVQDPASWEKEFDRFAASTVFSISYGRRVDSFDAPIIRERLAMMQFMASLNVPGAYLAESIPILKHTPSFMAPWKRELERERNKMIDANIRLVQVVRQDLRRGSEKGYKVFPSLTQNLLAIKEQEGIPLSERDFAGIPATLFGAGSDTTASTLCTAMLALVTHPEALLLARSEIDEVVGRSRTPTFDDEPSLPYIRALVREVLRWRPTAVLGGTPHASSQDDHYEGYLIPSGSTILGNSWAINLNPEYYPQPHLFNPARFLPPTSPYYTPSLKGAKTHPSKNGHSSFGWGRRICPGMDLAQNSLYIALAKMIWGFEILPMKEYDTFDYTNGFNIRPNSFECLIQIRSEEHLRTLEREQGEAERELEKFPPFL